MNITVKEVVEHILAKVSHGIGIDIPCPSAEGEMKMLCSLAEKAAGGEFIGGKNRGLSSIFDMLNLKDGEKPVGNITACYKCI